MHRRLIEAESFAVLLLCDALDLAKRRGRHRLKLVRRNAADRCRRKELAVKGVKVILLLLIVSLRRFRVRVSGLGVVESACGVSTSAANLVSGAGKRRNPCVYGVLDCRAVCEALERAHFAAMRKRVEPRRILLGWIREAVAVCQIPRESLICRLIEGDISRPSDAREVRRRGFRAVRHAESERVEAVEVVECRL